MVRVILTQIIDYDRTRLVPALKTYDLFISHAWKYNDEYYRLEAFLNAAPNFQWRNYSVPQHDPAIVNSSNALSQALLRQVRPVNCVLVVSGMYTNHREWMQAEITFAQGLSKPIVGIRPWGQQRVPAEVQNAAHAMVGWNTQSIVSAIRQYSI